MLSHADNEILTRTDQGTPMGDVMRCYWMPALLSSELPEADCPPVRVRLLGEDLVAFRDTNGQVGLLDEYCPPPPRFPLPGSQRGMRVALCLSWLEV